MANETISEKCETLYNKLNAFVTSVISRDVTPKISNLNTEVWGSDTQTGNSRIDTLNTNFNNLDSSITSMESDINNVESDVSNLQTSVNSLSDSLTNFDSLNTWEQIWTDGSVHIYCNKAIGISYLHFNKDITVDANKDITVHSQFNSNADEIKCCPSTATYCPTSRKNIFILVTHLGDIIVSNRGSSKITNTNVQAMVVWKAKGYPI